MVQKQLNKAIALGEEHWENKDEYLKYVEEQANVAAEKAKDSWKESEKLRNDALKWAAAQWEQREQAKLEDSEEAPALPEEGIAFPNQHNTAEVETI